MSEHDDEMEKHRAARRASSQTPEALARTALLKPHLDAHAEWVNGDRSKPFHGHTPPAAPKPERKVHDRGAHDWCRYCRAQLIVDQVASGTLAHDHKPAEFPDDCHICHAQRTEAEGH